MQGCKKFKDLILADYIDNELDLKARQEVEAHLVSCSDCRSLAKKVRNKLGLPLRETPQEPVPDSLWPQIKEKIKKKPSVASGLAGLLDLLYAPFFYRRLMPAIAGVVIALVAGSVVFYAHQVRIAKENEQGSYLVSLFEGPGNQAYTDEGSFVSSIEEYFL